MFIFFTILLVAIGLSMDTFSLSLSYGLFNIKKREIINISLIVGLFHFFMPILGNMFGDILLKILPINERIIIGIVFLFISFVAERRSARSHIFVPYFSDLSYVVSICSAAASHG